MENKGVMVVNDDWYVRLYEMKGVSSKQAAARQLVQELKNSGWLFEVVLERLLMAVLIKNNFNYPDEYKEELRVWLHCLWGS